MKAFWLPSQAPEAAQLLAKPDMNTYCPASGKKLRLKDLIPVRFTRVSESDSGYAMDPVTKDNFTNASQLVLLKPTGEHVSALCTSISGAYALSSAIASMSLWFLLGSASL
jgi:nitric oxide synthase-interacting protein